MLVSRLLRSLLRFLSPGIVPDEGGGADTAAPAPAPADAPSPAPAPAEASDSPAPSPAPAPAEPADPFAALDKALDAVSETPASPAPTPAPTAAPAPTPAPTAAPAAKAPEVDLTPPEGMSDRAKERWGQLTERAKLVPELERRVTEATTQLQSVRELVNNSGLDAGEFTDMLEMARLFKSGDPKALQQLDGLRADLATRLGVDAPGVDVLAGHADLKAEVEAMTLTRERAIEIARGRNAEKRLQGMSDGQQEVENHKKLIASASDSINTALATRANTPGHQAKLNYIGAYLSDPGKMQKFVSTYRPEQWPEAMLMIYDAYTPPAVPAPPAVPQPLRPTSARAGAAVPSGPTTAEGAVERAFDRIGL